MNNTPISQRDPDIERRQALVKIYILLLRLAEEAENKNTTEDAPAVTNQKVKVSSSAGKALPSQQV